MWHRTAAKGFQILRMHIRRSQNQTMNREKNFEMGLEIMIFTAVERRVKSNVFSRWARIDKDSRRVTGSHRDGNHRDPIGKNSIPNQV
jgi:hypothetical protein